MLTKSQLHILALSAQGNTYQEIAEREHLSEHTVKNHIQNAKRRLGAKNISQCVTLALALGLLELDYHGIVRPRIFDF